MKLKFWQLLGLFFAAPTFAVDSSGEVYDIYAHQYTGQVFFRIKDSKLTECATTNRYAIDTSSPGGNPMFSILLSAEASKKKIFVRGTDRCQLHGDTEDVFWIKTE